MFLNFSWKLLKKLPIKFLLSYFLVIYLLQCNQVKKLNKNMLTVNYILYIVSIPQIKMYDMNLGKKAFGIFSFAILSEVFNQLFVT